MATDTPMETYSTMAVHPGEFLAEELEARDLTQRAFATAIARPPQVVNDIVRGRKGITADTALDFEVALPEVSAEYWLGLQTEYDLTLARNRRALAVR